MSKMTSHDKFMRSSLRHLSELRDAQVRSDVPLPIDWFDIPDRELSDLGAMVFLASLSRYHQPRSLAQVVANLEPALRLSQYHVFRSDGYPRAFFTWAGLDRRAERQLAVDHKPLRKEQWNTGTSLWVMDLSAPFGHLEQVVTMMASNRQTNRVRTLWHNKAGTRARVIEWSRESYGAEIHVTSYGKKQFAKRL